MSFKSKIMNFKIKKVQTRKGGGKEKKEETRSRPEVKEEVNKTVWEEET